MLPISCMAENSISENPSCCTMSPMILWRRCLALPCSTRIIILKQEQQGSVGIIVDEVREVVTLGSSEIEKLSQNTAESKKSFITGVGKHNGELISLLDLNSITLEENA